MGSSSEKGEFEWEVPKKPRDIEKDMPHDEEILSDDAVIGKDKRGQFFVRFPRRISDALELERGFVLEFEVKIPIPHKKDLRVNTFTCEIKRRVKRRKVKKDAKEGKT